MKIFNLKTADFVVVSILALFLCWYAWSAWQTSSTVENMILIVPIAAIAPVLTVGEIIQQIRRNATELAFKLVNKFHAVSYRSGDDSMKFPLEYFEKHRVTALKLFVQ